MSHSLDEAFLRRIRSNVKCSGEDIEIDVFIANEPEEELVQRHLQELRVSGRGNFTRNKAVKNRTGLRQFVCDHYGKPGAPVRKGARKGMVRTGCNAYVSFVFKEHGCRKACIRRVKTTHIGHNPLDDTNVSGETIAAVHSCIQSQVHEEQILVEDHEQYLDAADVKGVVATIQNAASCADNETQEQIVWTETNLKPTNVVSAGNTQLYSNCGTAFQVILADATVPMGSMQNVGDAQQIIYIDTTSEDVGQAGTSEHTSRTQGNSSSDGGEPVVLMVEQHDNDHNYSDVSTGGVKKFVDPEKLDKCYKKGPDGKVRIDYVILEQIEEMEKRKEMFGQTSQQGSRKRTIKDASAGRKKSKTEPDDGISESEEDGQKSVVNDRLKDQPPLEYPITQDSSFWHNYPLLNLCKTNRAIEKNVISVGEIQRRIEPPESLCVVNVLKYLRVSKCMKPEVQERLRQCGLQCHVGHSQLITSFSKITEAEAEKLSLDYSAIAAQHIPSARIAAQHLLSTTMHVKKTQILASLHLLEEVCNLTKENSVTFDRATHTAGPSMLNASWNILKDILHHELKILNSST